MIFQMGILMGGVSGSLETNPPNGLSKTANWFASQRIAVIILIKT